MVVVNSQHHRANISELLVNSANSAKSPRIFREFSRIVFRSLWRAFAAEVDQGNVDDLLVVAVNFFVGELPQHHVFARLHFRAQAAAAKWRLDRAHPTAPSDLAPLNAAAAKPGTQRAKSGMNYVSVGVWSHSLSSSFSYAAIQKRVV